MNYELRKVQEIFPIKKDFPDNLFITCGSFEERFLGVPKKIKGVFPEEFILFKFSEPNEMRELLIKNMRESIIINKHEKSYNEIHVEHGRSVESILKLHKFLRKKEKSSKELYITVDISTFTKDLLLNLILYISNFLHVKKLRLLYTIPERYASPQEGWLSYGIKNFHIPPMCWSGWSPLKDNLLIVILGFEEVRAWALIDKFSSDLTWLFITNPGSKPEWNIFCEEYNKRLLKEIPAKDKISALDPSSVIQVLSNYITKDIAEKYNIFISPLGTKPQLIGTLNLILTYSLAPINIITTTVVDHNTPYYSWGVGDTFEFFFPVTEAANNE